jgi:hypothetical protein
LILIFVHFFKVSITTINNNLNNIDDRGNPNQFVLSINTNSANNYQKFLNNWNYNNINNEKNCYSRHQIYDINNKQKNEKFIINKKRDINDYNNRNIDKTFLTPVYILNLNKKQINQLVALEFQKEKSFYSLIESKSIQIKKHLTQKFHNHSHNNNSRLSLHSNNFLTIGDNKKQLELLLLNRIFYSDLETSKKQIHSNKFLKKLLKKRKKQRQIKKIRQRKSKYKVIF